MSSRPQTLTPSEDPTTTEAILSPLPIEDLGLGEDVPEPRNLRDDDEGRIDLPTPEPEAVEATEPVVQQRFPGLAGRAERASRGEQRLLAWRAGYEERKEAIRRAQVEEKRRMRPGAVAGMAAVALAGLGAALWPVAPEPPAPVLAVAPAARAAAPAPSAPADEAPYTAERPDTSLVAMAVGMGPPSADVGVLHATVKSWVAGGHHWIQFDYRGSEELALRWRDAGGELRIEDGHCSANAGTGTGRCYVGRSLDRLAWEVRRGAAPGTWTVEACTSGACEAVTTIEVAGAT